IDPRLPWTAALLHTGQPVQAWQVLEGHFGRGLLDDFSARRVRTLAADEQSELDGLGARLDQLDRQIVALLAGKEGQEANRDKIDALVQERKTAESGLAQLAARLNQKEVYDLQAIQAQLPGDTALVAWIDLKPRPGAANPGGEHW